MDTWTCSGCGNTYTDTVTSCPMCAEEVPFESPDVAEGEHVRFRRRLRHLILLVACIALIFGGFKYCEFAERTRKTQVRRFFNDGKFAADDGDFEEAIRCYSKAIKLDPELSPAYTNRGLARSELGDSEGAIADYSKSIELEPEDHIGYSNRGFEYLVSWDPDNAISDFQKAIELDPEYTRAHLNFAFARLQQGEWESAIAIYSRIINRKPPHWRSVYYYRGVAEYCRGQFEAANSDFNRAFEDRSELYEAVFVYLSHVRVTGQSWSATRKLSEFAAKNVRKAWPGPVIRLLLGELKPDDLLSQDVKGSAESRLTEAYYFISQWYLLSGDRDNARRYLNMCVDLKSVESFQTYLAMAELSRME